MIMHLFNESLPLTRFVVWMTSSYHFDVERVRKLGKRIENLEFTRLTLMTPSWHSLNPQELTFLKFTTTNIEKILIIQILFINHRLIA